MEHLREEIEQIGLLRQVRRFPACLCFSSSHQSMSHTKSTVCQNLFVLQRLEFSKSKPRLLWLLLIELEKMYTQTGFNRVYITLWKN